MDYVLSMKQKGFIETYSLNDIEYHTFTIEALADYLLARCLFDELNKDNISECIARIIEKRKKFYDLSRALKSSRSLIGSKQRLLFRQLMKSSTSDVPESHTGFSPSTKLNSGAVKR